jgi:hypothetical protein
VDHHGLLTLIRQLNTVLTNIDTAKRTGPYKWNWNVTPVIYPESHCPFCRSIIRSNGIWFFKGPRYEILVGAIFIPPDKKVTLIQPGHPHDTGGGLLCLGRNETGISLLASTPNLNDTPMGRYSIPMWLKEYWNKHDCKNMRDYLTEGYANGHVTNLPAYIQELDRI